MAQSTSVVSNERGSILVIALLILVAITLLGISATTTTNIETQIAGNDKFYKTAFFGAEGGTEIGFELLEQNIACPNGFAESVAGEGTVIGKVKAAENQFWSNKRDDLNASHPVGDASRDIFYPSSYSGSTPHTNIRMGGDSELIAGAALQMAAGYEGKGKGAAGGGASIIYDIYSQRIDQADSRALIMIQWRHMIGQEGECLY